jgi:hypothetical protein
MRNGLPNQWLYVARNGPGIHTGNIFGRVQQARWAGLKGDGLLGKIRGFISERENSRKVLEPRSPGAYAPAGM